MEELFTKRWVKLEAHFCGMYDRIWEKMNMELDYLSDDVLVKNQNVMSN